MVQHLMAVDAPMPAGQPLDVDALYRTQMRPLYAFIYSKVGNREAAEGITADVFIKALTHLDLTREERSIVAWLFRVARNAVNDYWREGHGAPVIQFEEAREERRQDARPNTAHEAQTAAQARGPRWPTRQLPHDPDIPAARRPERGRDGATDGRHHRERQGHATPRAQVRRWLSRGA